MLTASKLLPRLDENTSESAESDLVLGGLEAVGIGAFAESLLFLEVGTDLIKLGLNLNTVGGNAGKTAQSMGGIGVTSTFDEPTGRLR